MERQFTFLKMSLVGLFSILALGVSAQVVPGVGVTYVCNGGTVELQAPTGYDNYAWFHDNNDGSSPQPVAGNPNTETYTATTNGNYFVQVWDDSDCRSDLSEAFPVYVLPSLEATIAAAGDADGYCELNADPGIVLTATITSDMPTGLSPVYQWFESTDGSGTGRVPIDGATESTFQVTEATPASYFYSVDVKYNIDVKGSDKVCVSTSNYLDIIVTEQPAAPTITIVSTP